MSSAAPAPRHLDGLSAVITGGAQGIGRAMVLAFAQAGARVAIADRRGDLAAEVARAVSEAGGQALPLPTDITMPAQVEAMVAQVVRQWGRLDILVNNAGSCPVTAFPEVALAAWKQVFAVNVEGPLLVSQAAAAAMRAQEVHAATGRRGLIINVSSPAAEIGRPMFAAYGASKAALNHLSKTCAMVLGPESIAVCVLYPGSVLGPLWDQLLPDLERAEGRSAEAILAERAAGMPSGRFQLPEETAAAALYLAASPGMSVHGITLWSEAHMSRL